MAVNNISLLFLSVFVMIILIQTVLPGGNDLHFQDGASTIDVIAGDVFFEIIDPPELMYTYRVRPAKDFGAPFNESVVFNNVRLVPTLPADACSEVLNTEDVMGQVALIERGECSFVLKSYNAERAGAQAVIITASMSVGGNVWDEGLDHLIEMVDDKMDYDVGIPSAFLIGKSGEAILQTLRKLHQTYAVIRMPINMTYVPIHKMNQPPWISW